ncbi:general substrate transporter, partial [Coccomyxa subellipsoidea C-169]
ILLVCAAAACGGLLFGYDLGVTGGVTGMPTFLEKFYPHVLTNQKLSTSSAYCTFNDHLLTLWTSSMFLAGAGASAHVPFLFLPLGGLGRRGVMVTGGIAFLIGALLQALAQNIGMLIAGRIFLGIGIGFANEAVPPYISEMAPPSMRGGLNILFQLATTIGIFVASLINWGLEAHADGWRWSLGIALVPALVFTIGVALCPDTPNSVLEHDPDNLAKAEAMRPEGHDIQEELIDIQRNAKETSGESFWASVAMLYSRGHYKQAMAALLIPFFQQFTGMNAIMFYAPQLFQVLGFGVKASLMNSVITNTVNLVFTFVAIGLVDWTGRKWLFYVAGAIMFGMQIATGAIAAVNFKNGSIPAQIANGMLTCICIFVACFSFSWGPLGWLVPSEIHTNQTRTAGMCTTVFVNFIASFIIGQCFNQMMCSMEYGVFLFFAGWVLIMTTWVALCLPETKGIAVENVMDAWATYASPPFHLFLHTPLNACIDTLSYLSMHHAVFCLQFLECLREGMICSCMGVAQSGM